jgi:hypothetical protein
VMLASRREERREFVAAMCSSAMADKHFSRATSLFLGALGRHLRRWWLG